MRATGENAQHLLGSRERRLAVDYPVDALQRGDLGLGQQDAILRHVGFDAAKAERPLSVQSGDLRRNPRER